MWSKVEGRGSQSHGRRRWCSSGTHPGFTFSVSTVLAPLEAWRRIVDVTAHGDVVPLTTGSGPRPDDVQVGDDLVARTALGPIGFDDVMTVRENIPGKRVVLEKTGRMIGGTVQVEFRPITSGCTVTWQQSVDFPWAPRCWGMEKLLCRCASAVLQGGYRHFVTQLLR